MAPPRNAGWGEGEWVVAEADETDASFLRLRPEIAVVTNVELDHHSRWGSLAELHRGLRALLRTRPPASRCPPTAASTRSPRASGWWASTPTRPGPPLELRVPGRHNLLNARAALAALELAGLDVDGCGAALSSFPGMLRRLELKGGATARRSTTTTPTTRPRSRRRSRRCASSGRGA